MDLETTLNQSPIAKSTTTPEQYWQAEYQRASFLLLQFSEMLDHFEVSLALPILSSEDSHVRTLALREMESAWRESEADFSLRLSGSQRKLHQRLSFWKTYPQLELADFDKLSEHLPKWGMIVGGRVYLPQALEPLTKGSVGSYLPTPTAQSYGTNQTESKCAKVRPSLDTMARKNLWPTPTARDYKDSPKQKHRGHRDDSKLPMRVYKETSGGHLNPTWVEWLMGLPLEWTALRPSAMAWFLCKSKRRLKS